MHLRGYGKLCLFSSQSVEGSERVNIFLGVPNVMCADAEADGGPRMLLL